MMRNYIYAIFVLLALVGCSMSAYQDVDEIRDKAKNSISKAPGYDVAPSVFVNEPPVDLNPIKISSTPDWLLAPVSTPIRLSNIPFDIAVDHVLAGTGIQPRFSYDTTPFPLVTIEHRGSVGEALEKLAARSNFAFKVSGSSLTWSAYEIETFIIPEFSGEYEYMIGKPDQNSSGTSSASGSASNYENPVDTSAFDVDRRQYSNTKATGINPFVDASKTLIEIVGDNGTVIPSPSSSSILVKTTPDLMGLARTYMHQLQDELTSQVLLELKVVQVTSKGGSEVGVDWAAVKQTTSSQISFLGESAFGAFTDAIPVAFSGTRSSGDTTISVLVKALEEQGDVSFVTEQRILTRSGKLAELELSDIEGYLARSQTTNTADVGSTQELIPGIIQSGYTLYTMAKVFDGRVAIAVANRGSDLEPFQTVGTEESFIQVPKMTANRINVQQIIRSGTTVVAAAVRREESTAQSSSPLSAKFLPTYSGAERRVTDIYVLLTPRIIRDV